jgi:hypothetical protein
MAIARAGSLTGISGGGGDGACCACGVVEVSRSIHFPT